MLLYALNNFSGAIMNHYYRCLFIIILSCLPWYSIGLDASSIQITGVSDMLSNGEDLLRFAAKWGGIATVVGSALALGRGRMEGMLAQTICKILIVIGLLIAAFSFFGNQIDGCIL